MSIYPRSDKWLFLENAFTVQPVQKAFSGKCFSDWVVQKSFFLKPFMMISALISTTIFLNKKNHFQAFGEFRTGKTQLSHTLTVTAQMPGANGYTGKLILSSQRNYSSVYLER